VFFAVKSQNPYFRDGFRRFPAWRKGHFAAKKRKRLKRKMKSPFENFTETLREGTQPPNSLENFGPDLQQIAPCGGA
jgi:hypothetical protein